MSNDHVRIGYDYARFVTGEVQRIEGDLEEEAEKALNEQIVPDPLEESTMMSTSDEVQCTVHMYMYVWMFLP